MTNRKQQKQPNIARSIRLCTVTSTELEQRKHLFRPALCYVLTREDIHLQQCLENPPAISLNAMNLKGEENIAGV